MNQHGISRRSFIAGSIGALAPAVIGCKFEAQHPHSEDFDVCIVGSGFAGTFLALELVARGLKTLVIEAGTYPGKSTPANALLAPYFKVTNSGKVTYDGRGSRAIIVGGTSVHWGGVISRPFHDDLRMHTKYGVSVDWPIGYDTLEPYLCRSEQLLGVQGYPPRPGIDPPRTCSYPRSVGRVFKSPAFSLDGVTPDYFGVARSRQIGNQPTRLLHAHIPELIASANATLMSDRQVTRLITLDGVEIDHVETRAIGESDPLCLRARTYVLAAGAIENPRILLLSRSDEHPEGLGNRSGLVGSHFQVHPSLEARVGGPNRPGRLIENECRTALHDRFRKEGLNAAHVHFKSLGDLLNIRVQPEIEARFENRVTLSNSELGRFGEPLPEVSLEFSERDVHTLSRSASIRSELVDQASTQGSKSHDSQVWRSHPAGTTRMASREEDGVVDPNNQVFGMDNLYVSGASTFPTSGTANPTNLVVAMTLRLADHLIDRLES